jgi:hypothetical protein
MAQPRDYTRQYNFNDYQATSPSDPLRGSEIDGELNAVKLTLDDLNANIAKIQRDDGKLGNTSVHKDAFDQSALAIINSTFTPRGNWSTATSYVVNDAVDFNGATYVATTAHTSSAAFATDTAASRWILIANAAISGTSSAVDKFEGDGSTTAFTLSNTYASETSFFVFVNGELLNPVDDYTLSGTTLTLYTAPGLPSVAGNENLIVWGSNVVAQASQDAAEAAEANASGYADESQSWASKTNGIVEATDYSSKAWATGGTGVDAGSGSAKDWASKVSGTVGNTTEYSSKYWATTGDVPIVAAGIANITTVAGQISPTNNVATLAGISAAVTNLSGISSDVTTVSGISADVSAVAALSSSNLNTVATNIGSVTTVATNIAKVITVANDLTEAISEIETVADDLNEAVSEIEVVAGAITNVDLVGGSISSVNTLAAISTAVVGVNAISAAVTAVNTNSSNINTVSTDLNGSNNVGLVGAGMANVNLVGGSISNVNVVATNITSVNSFAERYKVESSDPSTSLDAGDLAFNTTSSLLKYYNGTGWETVAPGIASVADDSTPQLGGDLDGNGFTVDLSSNDEAISLPSGTTAQRPTPSNGMLRYNSDDAAFEGYADGAWGAIGGGGDTQTATTTSITETSVASYTASSSLGIEITVIATDTVATERTITKLLVTHDGTTAVATQYGEVNTATAMASYDVDISGGNVRLLATAASANSTNFTVNAVILA